MLVFNDASEDQCVTRENGAGPIRVAVIGRNHNLKQY